MKKIIALCLMLLILSCEKDNLRSVNDLEVKIDLIDPNNNSTRLFSYGEDLIFKYSETNNTTDTIYYCGTHCPTFHFKVYDDSDKLIGDAIPDNWGCTAILLLLNIGPKKTNISEISWFNDTMNTPLPIGRYKLKFDNTIDIPEINESKKYNLIIKFKIE